MGGWVGWSKGRWVGKTGGAEHPNEGVRVCARGAARLVGRVEESQQPSLLHSPQDAAPLLQSGVNPCQPVGRQAAGRSLGGMRRRRLWQPPPSAPPSPRPQHPGVLRPLLTPRSSHPSGCARCAGGGGVEAAAPCVCGGGGGGGSGPSPPPPPPPPPPPRPSLSPSLSHCLSLSLPSPGVEDEHGARGGGA